MTAQAQDRQAIVDRVSGYRLNPEEAESIAAGYGVDPAGILVRLPLPPESGLVEPAPWPAPLGEAAFHGVLGIIARATAPHTEADPVAILGTLLAMFGAACGSARTFYQGSQQRANLSVLLVGETGNRGRKGTALDVARAAFRLAYPELEQLWLVGVASGEAVTGHMARHEGEERVLLVEPEFGRVLTVMGREGSTLSPVLRNAWDGVPLGHARARDESLVTRHHIALLGHITPVELRAKLTDVDAANGFGNRLLFLAVRRSQVIPFPTSPEPLVSPFAGALKAAIREAHTIGELAFGRAARVRWEAFYRALGEAPTLGLAGALTGRHEAHVARMALVYALADRSRTIELEHLEAAIAIAEYGRRSAVWALGDSTGNRDADSLRRMLQDGPIAWRDASRALGIRKAQELEAAVQVLVDAGLAELATVRQAAGGRPRRVIRAKDANVANVAGATRSASLGLPA